MSVFNFAGKAGATFDETAAVHCVENVVFVELAGYDEYKGRRYFKVVLNTRKDAENLVADWLTKREQYERSQAMR